MKKIQGVGTNFLNYNNFNYITGFSGGAFALLAPLYTSETSEKCISGATSSMTQLMVTLGVGFVAALNINGAVHWVYITAACSVIPGTLMLWEN